MCLALGERIAHQLPCATVVAHTFIRNHCSRLLLFQSNDLGFLRTSVEPRMLTCLKIEKIKPGQPLSIRWNVDALSALCGECFGICMHQECWMHLTNFSSFFFQRCDCVGFMVALLCWMLSNMQLLLKYLSSVETVRRESSTHTLHVCQCDWLAFFSLHLAVISHRKRKVAAQPHHDNNKSKRLCVYYCEIEKNITVVYLRYREQWMKWFFVMAFILRRESRISETAAAGIQWFSALYFSHCFCFIAWIVLSPQKWSTSIHWFHTSTLLAHAKHPYKWARFGILPTPING